MKTNILIKLPRTILILIFTIVLLVGCEKDDICIEDNTPRLIIRFNDFIEQSEFKTVEGLAIKVDGIDDFYYDEGNTSPTDSIVIPLQVNSNSSKIGIAMYATDDDPDNDNIDYIDIKYTITDEFVSRSCGYKSLYYDIELQLIADDDNWIEELKTRFTPQNIIDEEEAHLRVYH